MEFSLPVHLSITDMASKFLQVSNVQAGDRFEKQTLTVPAELLLKKGWAMRQNKRGLSSKSSKVSKKNQTTKTSKSRWTTGHQPVRPRKPL